MKLECVITPWPRTPPRTRTCSTTSGKQDAERARVWTTTHDQLARRHAINTGAARLAHLKPAYCTISHPLVLFVQPLPPLVTRVVPHLPAPALGHDFDVSCVSSLFCPTCSPPTCSCRRRRPPCGTVLARPPVPRCTRSLGHRAHCWRVAEALYLVPRGTVQDSRFGFDVQCEERAEYINIS